jgi:hypothetical protein
LRIYSICNHLWSRSENAPRTVPFQVKRKEDSILEKFIKRSHRSGHPILKNWILRIKQEKVQKTRTIWFQKHLHSIYADQMLYEKAIATYKKLSLKVPEKSTYFADQIRELEKKVN